MAESRKRVTVVTGASGGLGPAVVEHLATSGHELATIERKKGDSGAGRRGHAFVVPIDVSSVDDGPAHSNESARNSALRLVRR
jgi:NAD(P)-dependent dehydrogenase (short-subunit alcohol dehydrogenase family)